MTVKSILRPAVVVAALAAAAPATAQSGGYGSSSNQSGATVTASDIQRLQDQVYDAGNEVSRLRSRDQSLADRLSTQLDDLRDEVVYLKVKMRKEGSVNRGDYTDVRSRIESVRSEARGETSHQGSSTWGSGSSSSSGSGSGSSGSGSGAYGTGSGSGSGTYGGAPGFPQNADSRPTPGFPPTTTGGPQQTPAGAENP